MSAKDAVYLIENKGVHVKISGTWKSNKTIHTCWKSGWPLQRWINGNKFRTMKVFVNDILEGIVLEHQMGSTEIAISNIVFDSRQANSDTMFVALRGTTVDAHTFIPQVIEKGCKCIVSEELVSVPSDVCLLVVKDSAYALGLLASQFYGNPSEEIQLVGVTGTNGKTTITTLLYNLFTNLGYKVGLLSTVVNKIAEIDVPSTHTTPNPVALNALLREMVDAGCEYCFMEVSSHAIAQHRIAGLKFTGGAFTNITHDHLDYHGTFQNYIKAKKAFFDSLPKSAFALTNLDDKNGMVMLQNTKAKKYTYASENSSRF
jgi:UDP-N-acetylmuramoyl-L-alanyl-D-glutamate--2,6-diaminopimelate ligase